MPYDAPPPHDPTALEREAYFERLSRAEETEAKVPITLDDGRKVVWMAQPGSQWSFIDCPFFEVLLHGTRGPGKTDGLIMSFTQHVGKGWGAAWRGILFRQTYPQLADVVAKTKKWFPQLYGNFCQFNEAQMVWKWNSGEALYLRHMRRPDDYWNYHGHEYPWIGWEELTNWANDLCYLPMFACCRSTVKDVPRMVRATTNPYGVGHNWVKDRFNLHGEWWKPQIQWSPMDLEGNPSPTRAAIHGHIRENKILLEADPGYIQVVAAAARNKAEFEAWMHGSWDIVAGGMFDDVWDAQYNIMDAFPIPVSWRVDRSFDWGSSAPFSSGWWAESDGTDVAIPGRGVMNTVRGDLFRIHEWYGWSGKPNVGLTMLAVDISLGIVERELAYQMRGKVKAGPADSSIFKVENGMSIAVDMAKPVRIGNEMHKGIVWTPADKSPGSRKTGWEMTRKMMRDAHPVTGRPREKPGLFVFGECKQFIRTVPTLPRLERDMDDVDTDAEDHVGDETRYRVRSSSSRASSGKTRGMY